MGKLDEFMVKLALDIVEAAAPTQSLLPGAKVANINYVGMKALFPIAALVPMRSVAVAPKRKAKKQLDIKACRKHWTLSSPTCGSSTRP